MAATPNRMASRTWRPAIPAAGGEAFGASASAPATASESASSRLPFLLFCLLTFVVVGRPNDYIPALVPLRLALVMTALTVAATVLFRSPGLVGPFRYRESKLYLAFFATMCFGVPFAMHRGVSFEQVILVYTSNIAYFLLFVTHVNTRERFKKVLLILLAGAVLFSVMVLLQGTVRSGRLFAGAAMYDPNDMAYVELAQLPFALSVLLGASTVGQRGVALVGVVLGALVTLYTGSRGGLLGLATFVVLFVLLRAGRVKAKHKILLLLLMIGVTALNADKINFERYETLTNLQNDYNLEEGGRLDVWKTGLRIFMDDPLTGVGANNFAMAIGNRRLAEGEVPRWQAPHNSFVQVLVEIGIVGFVLFTLLVFFTLRAFWNLRRLRKPKDGRAADQELAAWGSSLFVGFVAQLVSATFLTMAYSVFFPLFFAVGVVLSRLASDSSPLPVPGPDASQQGPPGIRVRGSAWGPRTAAN